MRCVSKEYDLDIRHVSGNDTSTVMTILSQTAYQDVKREQKFYQTFFFQRWVMLTRKLEIEVRE